MFVLLYPLQGEVMALRGQLAARQIEKAYEYAAYMFVLLYPLQGEVMALRGQLRNKERMIHEMELAGGVMR
jgi:hypothetical protein